MQTVSKIYTKEAKINRMTVPKDFSPTKLITVDAETLDFSTFISSQHPLISVWLVFSLISIGILSILLYVI